ncbi:MAG: DUF1549 domain-containing protein [Bryobacterales bacterium]|nr:DUF1549 domain-containing protein [Bryobacterales bacterium]
MWMLVPMLVAQALPAEFFEAKIRPVLAASCYSCHSGKTKMAGLDLSDRQSFQTVVPKPERLLGILQYTDRMKMPPTGKLPAEQLRLMEQWIGAGAPWPETEGKTAKWTAAEKAKQHWAFQPVRKAGLPAVVNQGWVKKPLDRFVLAGLEGAKVEPAAAADRATLLRRLTYDLTGLPPTAAELDAFLNDRSERALETVLERLLSSPRYGEQWGRHWLDVARYADSTGMDEDHLYPHAWRYRDYVVKAFNEDKPFNRFVVEQLAGDLLPDASNETVIATGFLAVGPKPLAQQDRKKMIYDVVDEQIDTTSKAFLGLTVSCARCHDHKFDPILTRDYYGMASIFASTQAFRNLGRPGSVSYMYYAPLDREAALRYDQHRRKVDDAFVAAEEALDEVNCARNPALRAELANYLAAAWEVRQKGRTDRAVDWSRLEKFLCLDNLPFWKEATSETLDAVAEKYAAAYDKQAQQWDERLHRWLWRYKEEAIQDRDRPGKPSFDPVDDPVFYALTFKGGPFDLPEPAQVRELRARYGQLKATMPPEPELASAVRDGVMVTQPVFLRGDQNNPGPVVDKSVPQFLATGGQPAMEGSGRRQLAEWIASEANPLTARVIVNRVWQWHFGEALVRTPNNWGTTGEKPTHPELLDYLAAEFVRNGWSLKWLHREIVLSATYGMSAHATAAARSADAGNRLFSRFPRRRLSVEELRDSLLAIDGSLDMSLGGSLLNPDRRQRRASFDEITRRTMYLPVRRGSIPTLLSVFDYGDASTSSEGRPRTNVAPQALFAMNSPFVNGRAGNLAQHVMAAAETDADRVRLAVRTVLSREAAAGEIDRAITFVEASRKRLGSDAAAWASYCRVLLASNEFVYLN